MNGTSIHPSNVFLAASSDSTNFIFLVIILITILLGIILAVSNKLGRMKDFLPSFAVSCGIFGTFWGIFVGLSEFDTTKISESIPSLLDGMKTAFFTSIIGMAASLILKIIYNLIDDIYVKSENNPIKSLQSIEIASKESSNNIAKLENTVSKCFKSDEEYSLVSQVKLVRQELIDGRRETKKAFEEFINHFSKMASESLVEELSRVIDKFNAMLSDLVSQSFRDLKDSTERLNAWQSEYKETIRINNENLSGILNQFYIVSKSYELVIEKINSLTQNLEGVDKNLGSIALSGRELSGHATQLSEQNKLLETSIIAIKDAGEKAAQVVPDISIKMNTLADKFNELQHSTNEFVNETTKEMKDHSKEISNISQQQILAIQKSLEEELRKSLESFASIMLTLSNKFAQDYTPLTENLKEIVSISQRVRNVPTTSN